jgi:hypothetical protein
MLKSTARTIVKRIAPPALEIWTRLNAARKPTKLRPIDLSLVSLIRSKNPDYLIDPKRLESDLLPKLGLNDESPHVFPEELHSFCGRGLFSWQYPNQFSRYLVQLSKFNIETYLEIGVRHGGTFVVTVEYLEKFHPLKNAVGIDILRSPSLIEYSKMNPKVHFMRADSQSYQFKKFVRRPPGFDLVLIDGSHEEPDCEKDFMTVKDNAKVIVFHDIASNEAPGVVRVWNRVKALHSKEYTFFEFTEQYRSVMNRTGQSFLGIGIAAKKKYL